MGGPGESRGRGFSLAIVSAATEFAIRDKNPKSKLIHKKLDEPVSMAFSTDTPLEDVLKYIKQATATGKHPGLQIYVDPFGLQEAERSLHSTVQIDLEGVPLNETLRLCLKQLGLTYQIKDGHLRITSEDEYPEPQLDDPFLIVGHCLLALIAAAIGGVLAPLVSAVSRGRPDRTEAIAIPAPLTGVDAGSPAPKEL